MEIVLKNISKTIDGVSILRDINLKFSPGKIYGFTGDNGSGKTVLFKIILGFMKPSTGSIYIDNKIKTGFLQNAGMIIERPNFIPYYSAFRNLKIIASYKDKASDDRIREVIKLVGLDPDDKKKAKNYSLGMLQKLAFALAILEDPKILILDEPLNALDEASVKNIRELILNEKEKGKLILLASHYKEDISVLCDVVYEMKEGKVINNVC